MSCIITYKGKKYSEEQFKEYFINNKQEFATPIAKNKDVIDSFKRKMEGIDYVFSQSPELASIGSKAQYLQYLSTIFKTSKVKDIVYHGSPIKDISSFEKGNKKLIKNYKEQLDRYKPLLKDSINNILKKYNVSIEDLDNLKLLISKVDWKGNTLDFLEKHELGLASNIYDLENRLKQVTENQGIFFTDNKKYASSDAFTKEIGRVYSIILDIKNPKYEDLVHTMNLKKEDNDSIIGKEYLPVDGYTDINTYVVFESEQIHILGSKQDIENFKKFVEQPINKEIKPNEVEITKSNYTRQEVKNNPNTAYVFTENTHSITAFPNKQGGGSAIIRPEPNAFAIVTKKKYDYNTRENVDYTDTDASFKEFTDINTKLIQELKNSGKSKIVFPQGFATDKAKMPTRFAEWLQKELLNNFGLITELNPTKTGLISKNVNQSTEIKPKIDSSKKIENLKRGDIINFQQQEFLVERVKNEGIDVRDVNTGDVDFISTEDYINETQEQPIVEKNAPEGLPSINRTNKNCE